MTTPVARLTGAVWGMFVGDAYCLGSHWIYDETAFRTRFPDGPAGFDVPAADHYHAGKPPGGLTHYGDGALLLLESLAAAGRFEPMDYGERINAVYGVPAPASYVDKPTRHLVERRRAGNAEAAYAEGAAADDAQNVTTSRLAPLVVRYAGAPELMLHVDRATRVLQENDRAVAYACAHARLLTELLAGAALPQALDRVAASADPRTPLGKELRELIAAAREAESEDVDEVTGRFGRSCPLVKAFPASLHNALAHRDDFAAAIRTCGAARGDNASRAMLIGSWLGAIHGIDAVPPAWRERLVDRDRIDAALARLLATAATPERVGALH
ncbi:MAG: ADP-ribosylglycohydrolase family protein [Pseudomonadota bacterium]